MTGQEFLTKAIVDDFEFNPIIGRAGFFKEFEITFSEKEEKIWLKKLPNERVVKRSH